MNPTAFSIFGIDIKWYGVLISTGIILGLIITNFTCKKKNISYDTMIDLVLVALPSAIIGARLYYVIFNLGYYKNHLNEIVNIRQGGLAIHGGVSLAIIAAYIYNRKKKIDFIRYVDAAAPAIIIAQAIGRWGNFFNQEAHGGVVSESFIKNFPAFIQKGMFIDGAYYHPTFLYESVWNFVVFVILMIILYKTTSKGLTIFSYIGLYSLGRFFIEGLRTDSLMIGPLRTAQLVSLCGVAVWLIYLYLNYHKKKIVLHGNK